MTRKRSRKSKEKLPPRVVQEELLSLSHPVGDERGEDTSPTPPPPVAAAEHDLPVHAPGPLGRLVDENFLQFASYTICHRAIPAVEDGLKPVQRRILHALSDKDDGRFIKVANIVGHTMQYHPHGDASIGDALVALTNKQYLIEGQGNFGNVLTGDRAAAARYIECRLTQLAREEVFDSDLTEYAPSYDGRNKEPVLLPARIPLLLMLGADGIAVGLSTRIFPHNFIELLEAQIAILRKKPFALLPDFIQGGLMDVSEYDKGRGRVKLRAHVHPRKTNHLVITSVPFGSTTESLIASIEDAVKKKKVPVRAIHDFTAEKIEIDLTLTSGTNPEKAIKALYAFTDCETAVTGHPVVLRENRPCEMDTHEILRTVTEKLVALLTQQLEIRRHKLKEAVLNRSLIQIFVEERIYKRIEECETYDAVHAEVRSGLEPFAEQFYRALTRDDIEMLLGVRIRRISLFDINKNREEIEKLLKELAEVEGHLAKPVRYAIDYLKRLIREHKKSFPRRTQTDEFGSIELRTLAATQVTLYRDDSGYLGTKVGGDELFTCSSLDKIVLVWKNGVYRVMQPPEKVFVDKTLVYAAPYKRDTVMTLVYRHDKLTYMKRFKFGGAIMNRDYNCAQEPAEVLLFTDEDPDALYVKYKPAKNQRIHQQFFRPHEMPVKGAKARGNQMTAKRIARIATTKPRWWDDESDAPDGVLFTP